ncbi:ABC transporter permease [Olivibacter sp. CPCC 100613]|uniref:ABC transporter permease n=1 Tax=Olivibacter sp. CPCC 100613 TaxID=3079931 RepID=UPI002FF62F00
MNKIILIIRREYLSRVKKKSFLVTTFLVPFLFIAMYALIFYVALNNQEPLTTVYVVDQSGFVENKLEDTEHLLFLKTDESVDILKKKMERGETSSLLLIIPKEVAKLQTVELYDTEKKGIATINTIETKLNDILKAKALADAGIDVTILNTIKPAVSIKSKELTIDGEKDSHVGTAIGISFGLSILIYISLFLYGNQVMRGIIEEKSNRIIEVVISSVKPFQLMMGKIIGVGLVGVTQFILWIILSAGFMTATSAIMINSNPEIHNSFDDKKIPGAEVTKQNNQEQQSRVDTIIQEVKAIDYPYVLGCFLIYFIGGYLLYSALFAMVGSAVDSETETQQFMLPIIMPLLFTYMLSFSVLINNPHGSLAFWLSMIPFTSPIGMLVRIPFGVPIWQLLLSITLLIIGFLLTTYVAARIYRIGILMYGKKASYKELFKWFRYKG